MDSKTFDDMTRRLAAGATRRRALGTAAAVGALMLGRAGIASAAPVETEANKCKGRPCVRDKNCGKGLICNADGECEYKKGKRGKKNDTCCKNKDCKGSLKCQNRKCTRK